MAVMNYTQVVPLAGSIVTTTGKAALKSDGSEGLAIATVSNVVEVSQTPVVSASPDYSTGDVIGAKLTFAGAVLEAGGSALFQAVTIGCKVANTAAMDLILFNADPSASTFTDNAALDINAADQAKWINTIHITDWTSGGTPSLGLAKNDAFPFSLAGTALYGVLVARGTVNLASTSDITVSVRLVR